MADGGRGTDIQDGRVDGHDHDKQFTQEEEDEVLKMTNTPGFLKKILDSICPTVFGHQEIKTAVLLMLLGGVHKSAHEGIYSRGNINVCIVGDPSCAKSQFLKYAVGLVPRSVYSSGKTSSAAGLTATVANEPETGGLCIETVASMLADKKICCIDEFDKMDITYQVAIHEALKQQTISIIKSGVQAPLNAGTSILAAANPNIGGYDKSKPLKDNVSLIPAIRWRFDLVHVMIDELDENTEDAHAPEFTVAELKRYIAYARSLKPKLSLEASKALVESLVTLHSGDAAPGSTVFYRMRVRQIEAQIRLSEALARSHLQKMVLASHVHMAVNLLKTSIISVESCEISSEIDLSYLQGEDGGDVNGVRYPNAAAPDTFADAAGDHGTENGQKEKGTITEEHFQRVTQALVMHLGQHIARVMRNGSGLAGMKQRDLIVWYVRQQNAQKAYSCRDKVREEIKCIKAIIERLIRSEGRLLVVDDGTTASPTEGSEASTSPSHNRLLALAPNYVIDPTEVDCRGAGSAPPLPWARKDCLENTSGGQSVCGSIKTTGVPRGARNGCRWPATASATVRTGRHGAPPVCSAERHGAPPPRGTVVSKRPAPRGSPAMS